MDPAPLAVWAVDPALPDGSLVKALPLALLDLPEIRTPRGAALVNVSYAPRVQDLNVGALAILIQRLLRSGPAAVALDIVTDANPRFRIPHLGSWVVNMHRSSSVLPAPQAPPFDPAVLNPNLIDSQVTVITTPAGKTQYAIKAVAGFDIPWAFSMSDLDLTFTFGVYSLPAPSGNPATAPHHLIDVSVTPGALHAGPQNSLLISALTDHEHTDMLMALVGQLADGIDAAVSVQDIRISYLRGRSPLPWLEDLAAFIKFDLTLPGVSDLWFFNAVAKDSKRSMHVIVVAAPLVIYSGYQLFGRLVLGKERLQRDPVIEAAVKEEFSTTPGSTIISWINDLFK
ncbi:hypothetical protein HK105_200305 [Polyrhizophydium stewartii]|uniref:Uncharacterized protein n=1 Tax=Polyrhizophydium stewartii TaxID=2732419 RepID=A0ABR4NL42_9FUNG